MSTFEILMPKMGESVEEATITKWFVSVGDTIKEDDVLLEIATDKVDSEIPSPVDGVIKEILYSVDDVVAVGKPVAIISLEEEGVDGGSASEVSQPEEKETKTSEASLKDTINISSDRFYSPLVRSIAKEEGISNAELEKIKGTGKDGRVTKNDILDYLKGESVNHKAASVPAKEVKVPQTSTSIATKQHTPAPVSISAEDDIVTMDRMRKLIAEHMVMSKHVSPHVTSVVEADLTNIVLWREKNKDAFYKKHGVKITYMPIITEAIAKALKDFPGVNASVDGDKIIYRKQVNVGLAVALPSGNLIVPVIKQADKKNLVGLSEDITRLAGLARENKLTPDDIQGGTFTVSNFGSFQNIIGTPIINQPQVAILATGSIEKKPAVIETPTGDVIGIRHKMFLSLSYDHRVVDGMLGGSFLKRIADYLEAWDINQEI